MAKQKLYRVSFLNQGKCIELYARSVASSELWGFVAVADLAFDNVGEGVVIDPSEERLREEYRDTRVLHLPMHALLRVEEVDRRGSCRISDAASGDKVIPLPISRP